MSLSERIKKRRIELGLSGKYVAQAIGVAPSTYFEWEQGRSIQGEKHFLNLAKCLEMSVSELIVGSKLEPGVEAHLQIIDEAVKNIRALL